MATVLAIVNLVRRRQGGLSSHRSGCACRASLQASKDLPARGDEAQEVALAGQGFRRKALDLMVKCFRLRGPGLGLRDPSLCPEAWGLDTRLKLEAFAVGGFPVQR